MFRHQDGRLTFSPRMQSKTQGFTVRGGLKYRIWHGVIADLWDVDVATTAEGHYQSPDPRLFVVLGLEGGGGFRISQRGGAAGGLLAPLAMSFVPAGLAITVRADRITRIRHLDLHFTEAALTQRFGKSLDLDRLAEPRLAFSDPEIGQLATLIAKECDGDIAMHPRYGEGLVDALMARLFSVSAPERRSRPGLSRSQLRLATELINARCLEPFRLGDLASVTGMSETHVSHAFKASTSVPPHRWHMQARIKRVQVMLKETDIALTAAAAASGFNDQAHFTRVFKAIVGVTPAAWRRSLAVRQE